MGFAARLGGRFEPSISLALRRSSTATSFVCSSSATSALTSRSLTRFWLSRLLPSTSGLHYFLGRSEIARLSGADAGYKELVVEGMPWKRANLPLFGFYDVVRKCQD